MKDAILHYWWAFRYYFYLLIVVPIQAMWEYKTIFWYRAWCKERGWR